MALSELEENAPCYSGSFINTDSTERLTQSHVATSISLSLAIMTFPYLTACLFALSLYSWVNEISFHEVCQCLLVHWQIKTVFRYHWSSQWQFSWFDYLDMEVDEADVKAAGLSLWAQSSIWSLCIFTPSCLTPSRSDKPQHLVNIPPSHPDAVAFALMIWCLMPPSAVGRCLCEVMVWLLLQMSRLLKASVISIQGIRS